MPADCKKYTLYCTVGARKNIDRGYPDLCRGITLHVDEDCGELRGKPRREVKNCALAWEGSMVKVTQAGMPIGYGCFTCMGEMP